MFTLIDVYTNAPIATYNAPDEERYLYARSDVYIVDGAYNIGDNEKPLIKIKNERLGLINGIAGEKILGKYPDWKQRNMTARFIQLMTLSQLESQEAIDLKLAWEWIGSIRALSNIASNDVNNATNAQEIDLAMSSYTTNLSAIQ